MALAHGRTESVEDGAVERVFVTAPFGVPLHGRGKGAGAFHLEGFHQAIGRVRQGTQTRCQAAHALAVQGIHLCPRAARPLGQRAAGHDVDVVRQRTVLLVGRALGFAVVHQTGHSVHRLVQAAAQCDVDFLEAPANAEQRHALRHAGPHQREGERITFRVERQAGVVHGLVEVRRVNVGRRAGEHHAVDHGQQVVHLRGVGQREHDGLRLRAHLDGACVLVAQQQVGHFVSVAAQQTVVRRQPDHARMGCHALLHVVGSIVGLKLVENEGHSGCTQGATCKLHAMLSEYLLSEMARLDAAGALPLHRQLYEALRRAMLEGKLAAGDRLPSSRDLAQDLALSRNTVVAALGQLTVEGYLASQVGSGTYVHDHVPLPVHRTRTTPVRAARLSARGEALAHQHGARDLEIQPFVAGSADFSAFPVALWQRLQNKHWRHARPDMLDYNDSGGYGPLRRAVADYLRVFRSVQLDADQVIITSGTQQSLSLCAQLLADHGDTVWIEDPAYWGAVKAFTASGQQLHPVKVDDEGIAPTEEDEKQRPRLIYVTPSHQYPSGVVMSLARRQQLLASAARCGAWVLEDDYDSEFRFSGPPISSLEGLDQEGRVLYMGTFSKVLYPGLKLGYLVVPKPLVAAFKLAHYDLNRPGQMPLQAALAEFIEMGHFSSALRRARQTYAERREALLHALQPVLSQGDARIHGVAQGLHLCVRLPAHVNDRALAKQLAQQGLTVRPLSAYALRRQDLSGLVMGYGYASQAAIERDGPVLAAALLSGLKDSHP